MRLLSIAFSSALLCLQPGPSSAAEPGMLAGNAAFTDPDPSRFDRLEATAPTLARWAAKDGKINLTIKEKPSADSFKMYRSDVERDLLNEIKVTFKNAKLHDYNSTDTRDGWTSFTAGGQGENGKTTIYFMQKVFSRDGKNFRIVASAVGMGVDLRTSTDVQKFLDSVAIKPQPQTNDERSTTVNSALPANSGQPAQTNSGTNGRLVYYAVRISIGIVCLLIGGMRSRRALKS